MLQGSITDFSLLDIFRLIALTKKSGTLTVDTGAARGSVSFDDGAVSFAVADAARAAIGVRLVQSGLVADDRVLEVLEDARRSGTPGRLSSTLLQRVEAEPAALQELLRDWVQEAVCALVELPEATFSFDSGAVDDVTALALPTEDLVTEVTRRAGDRAALAARVPSPDAVLALRPAARSGEADVTLTARQWRILALLDGRRPFAEVAELSGMDGSEVARVLAELVDGGLVEVVPAGDPHGPLADLLALRERLRRIAVLELGEDPPSARQRVTETGAPTAVAPPEAATRPEGSAPPTASAPQEGSAPPESSVPPEAIVPPTASAPQEAVAQPDGSAPPNGPAARTSAASRPAAGAPVGPPDDPPGAGGVTPSASQAPTGDSASDPALPATDAGVVDTDDAPDAPTPHPATPEPDGDSVAAAEDEPTPVRRLTRDEDVNQGLLLRLIDGVKGA